MRPGSLRHWAEVVGLVVGLTMGYYALPLTGHWWALGMALGIAVVVGLLPLAFRQVRRIQSSADPLADGVRAVIVLASVVLFGFASTYYAIQAHSPGQLEGLHTKTDALYFTTTMLSTVGFGDITPRRQAARAVATVNMAFDLAFLATTIRLVTRAARDQVVDRRKVGDSPDP